MGDLFKKDVIHYPIQDPPSKIGMMDVGGAKSVVLVNLRQDVLKKDNNVWLTGLYLKVVSFHAHTLRTKECQINFLKILLLSLDAKIACGMSSTRPRSPYLQRAETQARSQDSQPQL